MESSFGGWLLPIEGSGTASQSTASLFEPPVSLHAQILCLVELGVMLIRAGLAIRVFLGTFSLGLTFWWPMTRSKAASTKACVEGLPPGVGLGDVAVALFWGVIS